MVGVSYIKSCRSLRRCVMPVCTSSSAMYFFRSDTEVAVNSTLRPSFCTVATRFPVIRSCSAARAAASSSCRVIHPLRIRHGRNLPVFSCWLLHHPLPAARQQCTEIQLPAGNTDAQRRQRINEAVERLIASLFAVPQYFFPAIHPFFDLLFSSQLLRFGQIKISGLFGK